MLSAKMNINKHFAIIVIGGSTHRRPLKINEILRRTTFFQ